MGGKIDQPYDHSFGEASETKVFKSPAVVHQLVYAFEESCKRSNVACDVLTRSVTRQLWFRKLRIDPHPFPSRTRL